MKFEEMTIHEYEDILAMKKSVPGGGSVLGLTLVNAISLCEMVYNFTVDKVGYENVRDEMISLYNELIPLKKEAYSLMNEDSVSFLNLMDAYKSKDEKQIEICSNYACEVPYRLFVATKKVESIASRMSSIGNKNVISDSMIGEDLCKSIYRGCLLNIKANIRCVKDPNLLKKYNSIL